MARVRSSDTGPEKLVRSTLHRLGYRYVLHDDRLPGRPDLSFPSRRAVVFVHGCFWHRHRDCRRAAMPKTRADYWRAKFDRNVDRDRRNQAALKELGWRVLTIWECELKTSEWVARIREALDDATRAARTPNEA